MQTPLFFGESTLDTPQANLGLFILRVFAGFALALVHGLGKVPPPDGFISMVGELGLPAPTLFAWLAGIAELGGGILLGLGLLTRPVALLLFINMTFAAVLAHSGEPFTTREPAVLFQMIALCFVLTGGGRFSLDAAIRRR